MGLFGMFKGKTSPQGGGNNTLDDLLKSAATNPGFIPKFYERLLIEELIVITDKPSFQEGSRTLETAEKIGFVLLENGSIPAFTKNERIFDKGIITQEVPIIKMNAEALFKTTKGATIVLNPFSDYGKELLPNEIEGLLNGTIFTENHQQLSLSPGKEIHIGQPAVYPTALVNALSNLFSTKLKVKAAYLGWLYQPSSGEPAHYVFGLDAEGDVQNLMNEAGFTAKQFLGKDEFVDFVRIEKKGAIDKYLQNETKPFYQRPG